MTLGDTEEERGSQVDAPRMRLDAVAGLLNAIIGGNLVYEFLFDNEVNFTNHQSRNESGTHHVTYDLMTPPNTSPEFLAEATEAATRLNGFADALRQRYELCLHWFNRGCRAGGLDGFIQLWVAVEAIGYDDKAGLRLIEEALAKIYRIEQRHVNFYFGLGPLHGLRSSILHKGKHFVVTTPLLDYMRALVIDLLREGLGLGTNRYAGAILAKPDIDIEVLVGRKFRAGIANPPTGPLPS
jgi:hypothetical protein